MLYHDLITRLSSGLSRLPDKPEETPEATLQALWHAASGVHVSAHRAAAIQLPTLDNLGIERLERLIAQRLKGIPLAYLTGRQRFMGLEMLTDKAAQIPRKETELLGQGALKVLNRLVVERNEPLVVDVCTGSGNLALALAFFEPKARIFAADLSNEALALARRNAMHLGMEDRVEFRQGDLLAPFDDPDFQGKVDLLVCNPPYISSRRVDTLPEEIIGFEPRLAFDGGPFGIRILERLVREAPRLLRKGGCLGFEVGVGQGSSVLKRIDKSRIYSRVRSIKDAAGEIRAILVDF